MKFGGNREFKKFSSMLEGLGFKPQFPLSKIEDTFYRGNYISSRESLIEINEDDVTKIIITFTGIDEVFVWLKEKD